MSDNMHVGQFMLSALFRLLKLLLVWQLLREPLITAVCIPLAIVMREALERQGERKPDTNSKMVVCGIMISLVLLAT